MKKAINVIILVLLLISTCITEQVLADSYLDGVKKRVEEIRIEYLETNNVNNTMLISKTNELENYWQNKEEILCNFVNHKDIEDIGVEITKMKNALKEENKKSFSESLDLVKFYVEGYKHIIGISLQNIF